MNFTCGGLRAPVPHHFPCILITDHLLDDGSLEVSDEQQVWDLTDPGGTPVARVVPTPDAQGKVRVTLYPTAHTGREAHEPVVAAIREKLGELGIQDDAVVWSQEEWPL